MQQVFGETSPDSNRPKRSVWQAVWRGFRGKCPTCGQGKLFSSFARCVNRCDVCGEELHHQRADDFPAYINITIVGHIVLAAFVITDRFVDWSPWTHLAIWTPLTVILAIILLQPIKGAVIGFQWAHYLHGFGGDNDDIEPVPDGEYD